MDNWEERVDKETEKFINTMKFILGKWGLENEN